MQDEAHRAGGLGLKVVILSVLRKAGRGGKVGSGHWRPQEGCDGE